MRLRYITAIIVPVLLAAPAIAGSLSNSQFGGLKLPAFVAQNLTYAGTSNPSAVELGAGNSVSFCPNLSCVFGYLSGNTQVPDPSYQDHQRASHVISAVTKDDGHSEEQTVAITTTINKGAHKSWTASTAYNVGDNIIAGNATYRACVSASLCPVVATTTVAGTSGVINPLPGIRPTTPGAGNSTTYTDGSVVWKWINDGAIDAKLSLYVETSVYPGAGFAEGETTNFLLFPGVDISQGDWGKEEDCTNNSGTDGGIGLNAICHVIGVGGSNKWLTGVSLSGSTDGALHSKWGLRLSGGLATDCALCVDDNVNATGGATSASYGVQVGSLVGEAVSHGVADYYNNATTPKGFLDQGAHSFAAFSFEGSGATAINVTGTYGKILNAPNVSLTVAGALAVTSYAETLTTPASSSAPCTAGQFTDDANYHYVCVATNTWKRVALSAF